MLVLPGTESLETEMPQTLEVEALGISWEAHWVPVAGELYLHYAFDITDRKKAEQALVESENKFKTFAEQALAGMYIIQDGIFKYINPKFAEMFGYSIEDFENDIATKNLVYLKTCQKWRSSSEEEYRVRSIPFTISSEG